MGTFSFEPMGNDFALNIEYDFLTFIFGAKEFNSEKSEEIKNRLLGIDTDTIDRFINDYKIGSYWHYVIPYTFEDYQAFGINNRTRDKLKALLRSSLNTYFGKPINKNHYDSLLSRDYHPNDLYYFHYCIELFLKYFDEIFNGKISLKETFDINKKENTENAKIRDQEQQNVKHVMICPHCGKEFEADEGTTCKICGKEIAQKYFDFDMIKEMLVGNYHCAINLFLDEEHFLNWAEFPLKKTGHNQYTVNGLTYKYNDDGEIIDVFYDFEGDDNPRFLEDVLYDEATYELGLINGNYYNVYKIMFDKIKKNAGNDVIYRIKNRGIEYYAIYYGTFDSPFFDSYINSIPVSELSEKASKDEIIEALKNKGMSRSDLCYETNLWGDYFFDAPIDEIIDTMSYFTDENIVK